MWTHIVCGDHWLIWLNLLLLLDIVVIPFATSLLAEYARQPGARELAALVYGGTWTFGGLVYNAIWWRAVRRRLVGPGAPPALTWRWGLGPAFYGISTLLALVSVPLSLAGFALMALVYLLPLPAWAS